MLERKTQQLLNWWPLHINNRIASYDKYGATVVQEVEKSFSYQKVASSIPCRSILEQDTESLIAPDVQCAISVNVKCVYIVSRTYVSRFG